MNRRKFITSLGAGVAMALTPSALKALDKMPDTSQWLQPHTGHGKMRLFFQPYELKLKHSFNLAKSSRTTTPDVQVVIEYDGIKGYGEASMPPYLGESVESVCRFLNNVDLSPYSSPLLIEDIMAEIDAQAEGNRAAKASIDIALHDLAGKIMRQPWHRIWGLNPLKTPDTSFTIGIDTADMVRLKVHEAEPYNVLKVKMGLNNDVETINIIRSMTDRPICVDVNQGWNNKEHALKMIEWLAERNCLFVEQPMPKEMTAEHEWLKLRSPLPIIADEAFQRLSDIPRLASQYHGINIKLMKSTGMHEAYKMINVARTLGLKVMIGCMTETSCAVSAAAQLSPLADYADLDGNLLIANDIFDGVKVVNGKITLDDRPGIGVTRL